MKQQSSFKSALLAGLQWLGAAIAFPISLILGDLILPLSKAIMDATPPTGYLTGPMAMIMSAVVNATILVWAARRSSFKGLAMWMQLFALSFGVQTFMTQIETAYFLPAFPLLHDNFQVYVLIGRGFVTSLLFSLLVVLLVGGFARTPRPQSNFTVTANQGLKAGAWLPVVYVALYLLFGYYVAWQAEEVRLFYGGTSELPSVWNQWGTTFMQMPELPVFQYWRGILWILCLVPLFKGFSGTRIELVLLSALALALLPTAALAFPNPLMPAGVSLAHFWEVSASMAIYGALCSWFVPQATVVAS
jgi:hypothetical protein